MSPVFRFHHPDPDVLIDSPNAPLCRRRAAMRALIALQAISAGRGATWWRSL